MTRSLPSTKKKQLVTVEPAIKETQKISKIDTNVGGRKTRQTVPAFDDVEEGGTDIVPELGLDDRLFTETEIDDEEKQGIVPFDKTVYMK